VESSTNDAVVSRREMSRAAVKGSLSIYSAGRSPLDSELDKLMDVFRAATAVAVLLEAELGLELTGHHKPRSSGFTNI
jgi:hypothetical protein